MQIVANHTNIESGPGLFRRIVCGLLIALNLGIGAMGAHVAETVLGLGEGMNASVVDIEGCTVQAAPGHSSLKARIARSRPPAGVVFTPEVTLLEAGFTEPQACGVMVAMPVDASATGKRAKRAAAA